MTEPTTAQGEMFKIGDTVCVESKGAPLPPFYGKVLEAYMEFPLCITIALIETFDGNRFYDSSCHTIKKFALPQS